MTQAQIPDRPLGDSTISELIADLDVCYQIDASLGELTWYGIGGSAALLVRPANVKTLSVLAGRCHQTGVPMYVLGGGANLLIRDQGVEGIVVKLDDPAWSRFNTSSGRTVVGAGHDLMKLVMDAARAGLGGTEALAGIPGTAGGAVRMNAGGAFGQIGPLVERVEVMDRDGRISSMRRAELVFGYRRSNITQPCILEVELALQPEDTATLRQRVKEIFEYKTNSQPLGARSAGCTFRNPSGTGVGTSAGAWIERAGLKGTRVGGAAVSHLHANFIVTRDGCRAIDLLELMEQIQRTVAEEFGVKLEKEVVVWP